VTLGAAAKFRSCQGTAQSGATTPSGAVVVFGCVDPAGAVKAAGGKVTADLSLIHGVARNSSCRLRADRLHGGGQPALKVASAVTTNPSAGPAETARQTLGLTGKSPGWRRRDRRGPSTPA